MRRSQSALVIALTATVVGALQGCSLFERDATPVTATKVAAPEGISGAIIPKLDFAITPMRQYRAGAGDELTVALKGSPTALGTAMVSADGRATLPRIGDTEVAGMTLDEIAALIAHDNSGVVVTLRAAPAIYVVGAVAQPGMIAYKDGLTLGALITSAGGATHKTDMRKVWIKPRHASAESRVTLDPALPILPGDVVRFEERYF